jgi:hypothetical protein
MGQKDKKNEKDIAEDDSEEIIDGDEEEEVHLL